MAKVIVAEPALNHLDAFADYNALVNPDVAPTERVRFYFVVL